MADVPENSFFESSEDLLKFLRERADDIEAVVIPTGGGPIAIRDPTGNVRRLMGDVGAWVKLCDGRTLLLHREDAEMLINDGILQRLKIKCTLQPPV